MARRLRPVDLDFIGTAPVRLVFAQNISAPPERVFRALAEDVPGWAEWFAAVTSARAVDGGAGREIRLRGGGRFRETVLAAKSPELYAYRVDATNAPGPRALAEEWRLVPHGTGTQVRWTFGADGTALFRFVLVLARPGLKRAFHDAVTTLDRRLAGN
ncbi:SRPBCC family protein [Streptomyces capoamus]|uniref:Polyketide cyclase n=1 Tax=Streptomyces capoamus TaxID=68183 RepID=A0A919ESW5_9ACTN|nr:SRPBCC family protein [Streptomyces capoamus]GGW12187.1 polyketide cyclase [Streptomyces libani subsp. rufus]GHG34068.1 polyketide cyclase [Streptomyces capoamus]